MKKLISLVLFSVIAFCITGCGNSSSIGIIGGADGPTAIFLSSNINWLGILGLIGATVAVIIAVLIIHRNKKKK